MCVEQHLEKCVYVTSFHLKLRHRRANDFAAIQSVPDDAPGGTVSGGEGASRVGDMLNVEGFRFARQLED